jgi:hypothetical protein
VRKYLLIGAGLLASLAVAVPAAAAAPARSTDAAPSIANPPPTCLIADGPHFTKTLACAGLIKVGPAHTGQGSYVPGVDGANAELTVTVEYQRDTGRWDVLADHTVWGAGRLDTATEPVHPHGLGSLRACVTVTGEAAPGDGHPVTHSLCSAGSPISGPGS